jgi:hypothetical protein
MVACMRADLLVGRLAKWPGDGRYLDPLDGLAILLEVNALDEEVPALPLDRNVLRLLQSVVLCQPGGRPIP